MPTAAHSRSSIFPHFYWFHLTGPWITISFNETLYVSVHSNWISRGTKHQVSCTSLSSIQLTQRMPFRLHVVDRKLASDSLTIFFALAEQNITIVELYQSKIKKKIVLLKYVCSHAKAALILKDCARHAESVLVTHFVSRCTWAM
jgi:hypothetical protein